jgi:hypothetical protein
MATQHAGGCLCEGVRYEFSGDPFMAVHCYCRDCQKVTGSAFATVLAVPRTAFHLLRGELGSFTVKANSGNNVTREFCQTCGSSLFTKADMVSDAIFIKAGSLDDASWLTPVVSCWTSRAQPWAPRAVDLQQYPENPPLGNGS